MNKIKQALKLTAKELSGYQELVAHVTEELLGNETSIERLSRNNTGLARSNRGLFNKIKNFISDKIKSNSKSERYRIAEYLFDNALKEIKEKDSVAKEGFDISNEISYAKKGYAKKQFKFQYENFPPDNETYNTAHQDALHWARLDSVEVSDQRLIYSNSYWYVVEKFSDFLNNYQVVERISNTTFDKIYKEIKENGRSGRIKSIQEGFVEYDKLNQPSYSLKARKSGSDSFETGHRRENSEVVRMVETESQGGERTGSNGARDSSQSRSNKQGIKFSLKDSDGNELDNSGEIRYSKKGYSHRNPNTVTQNEYEHHYWAIANNLLSKDEIGLLDSLVGKINKGEHFEQNSDGFYMLPVGEKGVLNKIVFTDGKRNAYSIDTVIKINLSNETDLSIERGIIYASERKGIYTETNGIVEVYYAKDFKFSDFKRSITKNTQNSNGEQDGARSSSEAKFSLKDSDDNELYNSSEIYSKEKIDIDEDFQKYYNPKIKNLLSNDEWRFWYSERAAYLQGAKFVNIDDNILIPVGSSKVVLTDTAFDNPYAKDVLITTEYFDGDAQSLIDYIDKGVSKYGYSIQEIWKLATNVYGETLFNIHNGTTGLDSENINKWESSNRQNDRTLQGNEDGNGASKGSSKTDKKISFSLKDSDGNELLPEQQEYFKNSKVVDKDENLLKDIRFSLSGKEFIDGVNQETVNNFVEKSKSNTNEIDVLEYAKTTVRLVKDVENDISDISEYVHVLRDNDIRHIFNSHGTQTKEKYPISIVDIENIPYITANYDKIYYRVSNKGLPSLLYIFALPDNNVYYIEQAVQNYGGKKLLINKQMIKTGVDDIPSNYLPTILNKQKKSDFLADLSKARKEHAQSVNHSNSIIVDITKKVNTNLENSINLENSTQKLKFSLKDTATYTLSDGQVKKKVANFTKLKVYSKVEVERVINSILDSNLGFEDYDISISGKNKAEVIEVLWKTLNTADSGKRTGISLKIADYIIDNAVMENIYQEDENDIHLETIKYLKPYLHKVDLRGLKSEIKYRYDTDNSVYLLWGSRKGKVGQSADQIAMELAESGFFIDAENEADIFFEMDRAYREAVRALKKKSDKFLADTLGKEEDKISLAWYKWIQDEIHKVGGIAIYPHPLWVYPGLDRYHIRQSVAQAIYEKGYCDVFEMFGGVDDVNRKLHELLYFELCEKGKKYPFVASSDAHGCLHHNQYYFDQACTIVFADTVENIPQSILNGYTTAVDNQKTDNRTVYGNVRLAQYTYFLLGAYYEYHDALCNAIGQAFLRYVSGDTSQNALIESLENELVKFNTDFFGR